MIFQILWISHTAQSRRNRFRNPNLAKKPTFSVWKENIWLQKTGNNIVRFKIIESNFFHLILSKLSEYWSYWLSWQSCPNNSIPNKSEKVKLKFRKTQYFFFGYYDIILELSFKAGKNEFWNRLKIKRLEIFWKLYLILEKTFSLLQSRKFSNFQEIWFVISNVSWQIKKVWKREYKILSSSSWKKPMYFIKNHVKNRKRKKLETWS